MDNAGLETLWDRYRGRLFAFIKRQVTSPDDAEDLLQEVFIRIHRGLCCLSGWTDMERWIYRVTRNLIIDHRRSRRRHEPLADDQPALAEPLPPEANPTARLAFSLRETIDQLAEPYRSAIVYTECEGHTQAEYASHAGLSLTGAKSRVQRGRQKLKALLLECCHFELDRLGGIVDYHERCCACRQDKGSTKTHC